MLNTLSSWVRRKRLLLAGQFACYRHFVGVNLGLRLGAWSAFFAGVLIAAAWGVSVAASHQVVVTNYVVTPKGLVGVGGRATLTATLSASSAASPAYALLSVPPNYIGAGAPSGCEVATYKSLAAAGKAVPSVSKMIEQGMSGLTTQTEVEDSNMLFCKQDSMAAGDVWNIPLEITATTTGKHKSVALASSGATPVDADWAVQTTQGWLEVVNAVDLTVTKTASANPVRAGDLITYTLMVSNSGLAQAPAVTLIDKLPAADAFEYQPTSGSTCTLAGTTLSCDVGAIAASGSKVITVTGRVLQESGTQTNDAEVKLPSSETTAVEVNTANNTGTVTVNVQKVVKIKATKTMAAAAGSKIISGQAVTMTLGATNEGVVAGTNVKVEDVVPPHFKNVTAGSGACTVGAYDPVLGTKISCNVGALGKDALSPSFSFTMTAVETTTTLSGTNIATVAADTPAGGDLVLTPASVPYTVNASEPVLNVEKSKTVVGQTDATVPAKWGDALQSKIVVRNEAANATAPLLLDPAKPIMITETLGAFETYLGYSGNGWSCPTPAGQTNTSITCTYTPTSAGSLALGDSLPELTISTKATNANNTSEAVTNTACVSKQGTTGEAACGSATVQGAASSATLGLAKTGNVIAGATTAEDKLVYVLSVTNTTGPDTAKNIKVEDTLPMWFKSESGEKTSVSWTATPTGTTCTTNDAVVSCTVGELKVGDKAEITITVGRPFNVNKLTNTFKVSSVDTQIPNQGTGATSPNPSNPPSALADVAVTKVSSSVSTMQVGVPATFRTDFVNYGANDASNVVVRQVIDTTKFDITAMSLTSGGTCKVVTFAADLDTIYAGKTGVECTQNTLASNAAFQMQVTVVPKYSFYGDQALDQACTSTASRLLRTASVDRDKCSSYDLNSKIWTSTTQSNTTNDSQTGTVQLKKEQVNLNIAINDVYGGNNYDPTALNGEVLYQVIIKNAGVSTATNVSFYLKGNAPNETGFSMASSQTKLNQTGLSCVPVTGNASWDWKCTIDGEMASGASKTFILPFQVNATATVAETVQGYRQYELVGKVFSSETQGSLAVEGATDSDSFPSDNQTSQKTYVVPQADVSIAKSSSVGTTPVDIHQPFDYVLTVSNAGPSAAAKIVLADTLDGNLELQPTKTITATLDGVAVAGACTLTGHQLNCTIPLLSKGKSVVVTVPVRVILGYTGTSITNTATVKPGKSDDEPTVPTYIDPTPGNDLVTPPVEVKVTPGTVSGKVVVAPDNTDLSTSPDIKTWPEVPSSAVFITLTGTDKWGNPVEVTLPKISGGGFSFEGIPSSDGSGYTITQTQPSGYLDYKDSTPVGTVPTSYVAEGVKESITGVTLNPGGSVTGIVFAEVKPASISGYTFQDMNADGVRNATGDQLLSAQTITLTGTDYTGAAVTVPAQQTSNGVYKFDKLKPGSYVVSVMSSTAMTYIGASIALVKQADATSKAISATLGSAVNKVEYNFGFQISAGAGARSIVGKVFVEGTGEPGIAGVKITLSGFTKNGADVCVELGAARCTTTTAADGSYSFTDLPLSNAAGYTVVEEPETTVAAYALKLYADGTERKTASPNVVVGNDKFSNIVLDDTTTHGSFDFGERFYSLAGKVEVVNKTGQVAFNKPLKNVQIQISGTTGTGAALCTAPTASYVTALGSEPCQLTTGEDGAFNFIDLPAGTYKVLEVQPTGYGSLLNTAGTHSGTASAAVSDTTTSQIDAVKLVSQQVGGSMAAINYLFQESANVISGWVYIDTDNNGDRATAEPGIGGVTITLTDSKGNKYETITNADGSYSFVGVPDETYTLTETQPDGYLDGAEKVGGIVSRSTVGVACSTANCNTISNITLSGGNTYENYLFAETGATIIGKVYEEKIDATTGNSTMGPSLEGVEVRLVSQSANAAAWCAARTDNCVTKTKADGSYAFEGVPPGSYEVVKNHSQLTEYYAKKDKFYTDGIETAGVAGGTVENRYFGTQASYNTIGSIEVTSEKIAAHGGKLDGYLFGVRQSNSTQNRIPPIVSGYVFMDQGHNRVRDPLATEGQQGWTATLTASTGELICEVQTNADGFYQFDNLNCPEKYRTTGLPASADLGGATFNISFNKDGNVLPSLTTSGGNVGTVGAAQITGLTLKNTDVLVEQNLPLDPEGVVYDAVTRKPVQGALIDFTFNGTGFDPAVHLVGGASFQTQTTGVDGRYSFILQNNFPSGEYVLTIKNVPSSYLPGPSVMIPPCVNTLNVMLLPNGNPALMQGQRDAPGLSQAMHNPQACPVSTSGFTVDVPFKASQQSTQYYLKFIINRGASSEILNNHIPLDPVLAGGAILVTKTTPKVNVAKGDLVPYAITATNRSGGALANVRVRDMLPPGFRYRKGSAIWNDLPVEPEVNGRELTWPNQNFVIDEKKSYQLLLMVGAGVGDGEYVNQAWAINSQVDERISNVAQAVVRVVPDPTFDCSDLIGKVFDDKNANGYQDQGESGIPNVRVVTARGLLVTTDADGRFHVACAAIPQADRGSNFVMKLDERTLPSGYRVTTENPRDVRVTRGKMVKLNFGATVHKVLRLEVDGRAFESDDHHLSKQWHEQVEQLLVQLAERPTVLRIAYCMTGESMDVVQQRISALSQRIQDGYAQQAKQRKEQNQEDDTPPLVIETESFQNNQGQGAR